ncbi:UDP-N-acetylmuramoyl-tripeptide--D-alanyl-D-alanine ligase [Novisyntrophococcus fermenticellae]|uniref:UDP-N-acetylmuramoyl-tripeptide--D-alanyl-D- alanine ligase n=1 Tax=Novisyntrophococcus fermenticellae TaxID=2068655 RepID=UPI001E3DA3F3|nr:UDP-N-acetylmuramoyl-tripeptide--D-alanyl-D-alanine ligase [Novisyntrophococcus fermenticellae]
MKNLTLEHIAAACNGLYIGSKMSRLKCVTDITTDSRKVTYGCLFIPIKGTRADGHDYIGQVMEAGALSVLSEQDLGEVDFPYIRVRSSLQAVKDIAEYYLKQLAVPVIGITGSVGKTSTKETVAAVLSQKYNVLKTQGNFNNELGLPLTVFRLREEHEIAVLEMGISNFGEMSRLAKIARPHTGIITNIGYCHLEFLKDRDGVLKAKTEMFDYIREDGHVILNGDDDKLDAIREVRGTKLMKFGLDKKNDIYADQIESKGLKGMACVIHTPQGSFKTLIPIPGRHMVYNALAAACAGMVYGLSPDEIRTGIESLQPVSGRFHIIETEKYTIIDDCYNANPVSMKASLEALQDGTGRKVALLGDMAELGKEEEQLHAQIGVFAGELDLDAVYCAGPLCEHLARGIKQSNPRVEVLHFADRDSLMEKLPEILMNGDTVLVKASHSMQFEKIVERLSAETKK